MYLGRWSGKLKVRSKGEGDDKMREGGSFVEVVIERKGRRKERKEEEDVPK